MKKKNEKKNKIKFVDDGRVVANMNVDGMPWYHPQAKNHELASGKNEMELTRKEKFAMTKGVLGASLLVGSIFFIVFGLFILFCVFIWFA